MTSLPHPEKMAALVSGVTNTMLGITFVADCEKERSLRARQRLTWRTALLPICGDRPLTVGLSSDQHGCLRLSAAMFACSPDDVDQSMMNDALCELVNMTAGVLKSSLSINQALGLPKILTDSCALEVPTASPEVIVMKANSLGLVLWVYEGTA